MTAQVVTRSYSAYRREVKLFPDVEWAAFITYVEWASAVSTEGCRCVS